MNLIDFHCDTASLMLKTGARLNQNHLCVDIERMRKAQVSAEFFAHFIYMKEFQGEDRYNQGYQYAMRMLDNTLQDISDFGEQIGVAKSYDDFEKLQQQDKITAFLTIEEGGIVDGCMERLEELYQKGVRLMTLLWNEENCMGFPNSKDKNVMKQGLKPFGIETVEAMNALGMLIDVSHLSDGGFWDVLRYSKQPVVASHSNARAECSHQRNLSDEMIRALAEQGGVAGLNFYPYFLNGTNQAGLDDLVRHLVHLYHVGGEDFVVIGTDFDGFDDGVNDVKHIGEMPCLYEALKKRKFTDYQINKIWNGNARRILKETL